MIDTEKEMFFENFKIEDYHKSIVGNIEDFELKIKGCKQVTGKDLEEMIKEGLDVRFVDTSNIKNMKGLFRSSKYKKLDLSRWNTSFVFTFEAMFAYCKHLEEVLIPFDTRSLEKMDCMFHNAPKIKHIDLSTFNLKNARMYIAWFFKCASLRSVIFPKIDFSNAAMSNGVFAYTSLIVDLKELNIPIKDLEKEGIKRFKHNFKKKNLNKICELDNELIDLNFLDGNVEDFSLTDVVRRNEVLEIYKADVDLYTAKEKDCWYKLCDFELEDLKNYNFI